MRSTLILVAIVGLLVSALIYFDARPSTQGSVSVSVLDGHRLADAVKIRWQFHERQPVEIRRFEPREYRLTEPVDDLASVSVLRSIAQTYESAMIGETPLSVTEENLQKTGLEVPRVVFEVEFEDGSKSKLEIGGEGPLGNDVFVRRDGLIYRGGLALFSALHISLDELREPVVFRTAPQYATEMIIDRLVEGGEREQLHLAVRDGEWRLIAPFEARADAGAARQFAQMVLGLRIDVFPPGVIRGREDPPNIKVTVRGGREEEVVEFWLDEHDNLLGKHRQRKIQFISENRNYYRVFEMPADVLRARVLVSVKNVHQSVLVLMVDRGEEAKRLLLRRQSEHEPWLMVEPVTGGVEPTAVNQLLTALNNIRALEFCAGGVDNPEFGFADSSLRVGYQTRADRQPKFIRFGGHSKLEDTETTYAARTDDQNDVVAVPKGAVDEIARPWTTYVPLQVLELRRAVSRAVLERRTGEEQTLMRDDQGDWRTKDDKRHDLAADIIERMRDLRGKRALLRRDAQLGDPDWTVGLGRSTDAPSKHNALVKVWERGDLPLLVQGPGSADIVFELSKLDSRAMLQLWESQ